MRRILVIFLALVTLQACTKESSHNEGLLSFGISGSEVIEVRSMPFGSVAESQTDVATKGSPVLPEVGVSELDNFIVSAGIVTEPTSVVDAVAFGSIKETKFSVSAGSYVASAYNCTEQQAHPADGFGCVRYFGTKNFDVQAGKSANVVIDCEVANSMVSVVLDESFLKVFKSAATEVTIHTNPGRTERPLVFDNTRFLESGQPEQQVQIDLAKCAFYPESTDLYVTIKTQFNSLAGDGALKEYVYSGTATGDGALLRTGKAFWHKVRISADLASVPDGIIIKVGQDQETVQNGISISGYNNGSGLLEEDD